MVLSQDDDGVHLELGDDSEWHDLNTVIALDVARKTIPRRNLALHQKVEASDGRYIAVLSDKRTSARIRLTDGQRHVMEKPVEWAETNYGWSSAPRVTDNPTWVSVDLAGTHKVREVHVYPRDDEGNEGLCFPFDLEVAVSVDGITWKTTASQSDIPQSKDALVLKFRPVRARYVRVTGTRLRPNPEDGLFSMQLVEVEVY